MSITGEGWEMHVQRIRVDRRDRKRVRTVGNYQIYHQGQPIGRLTGMTCECNGPGDNSPNGNAKDLCIEAGRYPLSTQGGVKYKTLQYLPSEDPAAKPKPGIAVGKTGSRTAILIHPGHPPGLFLSSVGCINSTKALGGAGDDMEYLDSRRRTIAIIDDLKSFAGSGFPSANGRRIPNAWLVIDDKS
jgi:hypothetical protein